MKCACAIFSSVACPALHYFSTLSHKLHDFRKKKLLNIKCVFRFSLQPLSETFIILRRNERDMIMMLYIQDSQEECARLRESVPYVKVYRYNPKHLYPKLNGYEDNGQRKVRSSCGSTYCTRSAALRDRIFAAAEHIRNHPDNVASATHSLLMRAENCVATGGHFEQLL